MLTTSTILFGPLIGLVNVQESVSVEKTDVVQSSSSAAFSALLSDEQLRSALLQEEVSIEQRLPQFGGKPRWSSPATHTPSFLFRTWFTLRVRCACG